ncbi:hypothetical protein ACW9YV_22060 (plasmid) [Paraburkholderia strydomiana]
MRPELLKKTSPDALGTPDRAELRPRDRLSAEVEPMRPPKTIRRGESIKPRTKDASHDKPRQAGSVSARHHSAVSVISPSEQEPIANGLLLVAVLHPDLLSYVRALFEFKARTGGSIAQLPMPPLSSVHSLRSGSKRKLNAVGGLSCWEKTPTSAAQFSADIVGRKDNFDWCCAEGLAAAVPIIESGKYSCITMAQTCRLPVTTEMTEAFQRYAMVGERSGVLVILLVVCTEGYATSHLHEFVDEYIEVNNCEPDASADSVVNFSVEVPALAESRAHGIGKSMYEIRRTGGQLTDTETPFVSCSARDRAVSRLSKDGELMESIADKLGISTATVSRTLARLRAMQNGLPSLD